MDNLQGTVLCVCDCNLRLLYVLKLLQMSHNVTDYLETTG
jgi:hypothetical protein